MAIQKYTVHAWWDRPGAPEAGEQDLGEGWARTVEDCVSYDAHSVAAYLKQHPDAQGADVVVTESRDGQDVVVGSYVGERTIAGWIMSEAGPAPA